MLQLFFFTAAIILLATLNFTHTSIEIKRPAILLAASVFALFHFKKSSRLSIVAKIIPLYIIEMFFNQLSGRVFHIRSFSIHLSLIALAPLAASFLLSRFRKPKLSAAIETSDLLKSWMLVFAVIIFHMLLLFLLLGNIYSYGYEHNFAVLANMCLYFLVFIFSWQQLENIRFRQYIAAIIAVLLSIITITG